MEKKHYIIERLAGMVVGIAFIIVAFCLATLGLTLLPVIGVLLAIPVMSLSLYFLVPELKLGKVEQDEGICYVEHETSCPWPGVSWCPLPQGFWQDEH